MDISRPLLTRTLLAVSMFAAMLSAADLTLGTWRLNVSKSRFSPGPGFQSETRTYEQQDRGVKVTLRTVDGTGKQVTSVYVATPDGEQRPVTGSGGPADAVAMKQIDAFTAESTLMHAGKEIARTTRVVSSDGNTMTITYKGLDPYGTSVNYTMVFERVK
jgi:hypothetical protein